MKYPPKWTPEELVFLLKIQRDKATENGLKEILKQTADILAAYEDLGTVEELKAIKEQYYERTALCKTLQQEILDLHNYMNKRKGRGKDENG
jgi:hypothetical protein